MIVVSDTSPLAYLVEIGVADSLPLLFGEVYIPPAVMAELCHPLCPAAMWIKQPPAWLRVAVPQNVPAHLALDLGEQEAIALALELGATRLLIDEHRGRETARSLGLQVAGTLAVLIAGAEHQLFDGAAALDRLERTNFYASKELLQAIRIKIAEQKRKQT